MTDLKDCLQKGLNSYIGDPPDTDFQRGYLAALLELYSVFIGFDELYGRANALLDEVEQPN